MEPATIGVYEREADRYLSRRKAFQPELAAAFSTRVEPGRVRADLGCGPGLYLDRLGGPVVGVDAAFAMLRLAREARPDVPVLQADLEALPFRPGALGGAWASKSLQHIPRGRLPMTLARLHRSMRPGAPFTFCVLAGEADELSDDDFPGRWLSFWETARLADVLQGAGFDVDAVWTDRQLLNVTGARAHAVPDTVGEGMRVLVCTDQPSSSEADALIRFAARDAGLAPAETEPIAAVHEPDVGIFHAVNRIGHDATRDEHAAGFARLVRLVEWLQPQVVCVAAESVWRATVDPHATLGLQAKAMNGRPVYLASVDQLGEHLRVASTLG